MSESVHIGIALEFSYEYARAVMRGIVSYARPGHAWIFHLLNPEPRKFLEEKGLGKLDGAIGTLVYTDMTTRLRAEGVAAVNISNQRTNPDVPRVGTDDRGVGKIAARHFLDRGFQHFAFIDTLGMTLSAEREAGFAAELAGAGMNYCSMAKWAVDQRLEGVDQYEMIRRWLLAMPKPVALFATSDAVAWPVLEVCRDAGLSVPETISVLAADNDPMICMMSSPALSSVAIPAERIGYEAAAILDGMLSGKMPPREPLLLPAKEVVGRQSSDTLAIHDPELAAAVRYIRQHAGDRISVEDVVKMSKLARRSLERKFRAGLGRSPLEEIRRARLDRVRELLTNTDLAMPAIAKRSGFDSAVRLTTVFREETGMTPTGFRRQFRIAAPVTIEKDEVGSGEACESS